MSGQFRRFRAGSRAAGAGLSLLVLFAGCATVAPPPPAPPGCAVSPFSQAPPGAPWPKGWALWTLSQFKRPTEYRLVADEGVTVAEAWAQSSASGVSHALDASVAQCGTLSWRWKVASELVEADPQDADRDDAPARVVVIFDGDRKRFDFDDRLFAAKIKAFTGHDLPYATLIYSWQPKLPAEAIVINPNTARIRGVMLGSDHSTTGVWREYRRDLAADFRRAFGEEPGRIVSVGIMTDADNTRQEARAYYGDLRLAPLASP